MLPGRDLERYAVHGDKIAIALAYILQLERGCGGWVHDRARCRVTPTAVRRDCTPWAQ